VNMVSEGVDIPRLRVGVYATAAKTPLVFRQIVGRFVRTIPGRPAEPSWLYIPADPILRDHAATVETELRRALRTREDIDELEFDKPERTATEPTESIPFVPLSADVAPQMTLFGSAAPPAPVMIRATQTREYDESESAEDHRITPAFERRAMLRSERHRLVSEVRRRDGTSHREINAWLNHRLGITSVQDATLDQLERSVELLVKKLTSKR
jgi:superfamily II DNA or RNA helicase